MAIMFVRAATAVAAALALFLPATAAHAAEEPAAPPGWRRSFRSAWRLPPCR
ncbi:hypothetical protein AB0F11_27820 [Streptomyces sp. NPDC032472]|uniref:hypothetical protein n=1 Tax=Streptomyces sp. NPDC032472 TaxID=3155018 RepID=UPI0033E33CE4